jgi:hypothetical protein
MTDEGLRRVIEKSSGRDAGVDFHLAFSAAREDSENPNSVVAISSQSGPGFYPGIFGEGT